MLTFREYLLEVFNFDNANLKLEPSYHIARMVKEMYPELEDVETFETEHNNIPYRFYRFKHDGKYEVHFGSDENPDSKRMNVNKGSGMSKLIATGIKLYKEKLDQGHTIRYYGGDDKLNDIYKKSFDYINKKNYNGNLVHTKLKGFKTPEGTKVNGGEIGRK